MTNSRSLRRLHLGERLFLQLRSVGFRVRTCDFDICVEFPHLTLVFFKPLYYTVSRVCQHGRIFL